jgi:RNase P subunit RPR2
MKQRQVDLYETISEGPENKESSSLRPHLCLFYCRDCCSHIVNRTESSLLGTNPLLIVLVCYCCSHIVTG